MDNYREVNLLPIKAVGASGTETIDLAIDEPLTALYVYFRATNGGAVAKDVPPEHCIDKIEIVDGGKVYWSTSGPEAVAASVYEMGVWPSHFYNEGAAGGQFSLIPLNFGRYLGDEDFMFSASRLLNPQIKVTWTRNALHSATGYTLGVRVKAMQGVAPGAKALMVKNIRTFTSAASGIESTDLPVDLDYRRLFVRPYHANFFWTQLLTHLKLDCDVGKLIVFDISAARFLDMVRETFPDFNIQMQTTCDSNIWHEAWMGNVDAASLAYGTGGIIGDAWTASAGRWQSIAATDAGALTTGQVASVSLRGWLPQTTLCYQFGRAQDPASWFKAARYGQVRLELTQGSAAKNIDILLQRPTPLG